MPIVEFGSRLYVPDPPASTAPTDPTTLSATFILDAAGEKFEFITDAPKTGNIRKIHGRTGAVTAASGVAMTVGIETLNRTATPAVGSGTPWGTNTNGTLNLTSADDNIAWTVTLTADAVVTQGQPICVHITAPGSGTFSAVFTALPTGLTASRAYPYTILNGALSQRGPILALEYDDGTIVPLANALPPLSTGTTTTFSSASNPNTIGERFQVPAPLRSVGFWLLADTDGDFTAKLVTTAYHRANGTGILASRSVNNEDRSADGAARFIEYLWDASVDLAASTNYRWVLEPGATGITIYDFSIASLALMDAVAGSRTWHLTTANNPTADGDWTNHNSGTFRRLWGGLIFDGVADDTGGGSASEHSAVF